ncbi:MAG: hypothetical protein IRY85_19825 [Micromonosporaceae bacterium]|nr:hypothetical protein [Micromonosporaceae bacterium]
MQVMVHVEDGHDDAVEGLESWLRDRPDLGDVEIRRGRAPIRPGELGAAEILTFIATSVALPFVINAIYDFFRSRRRTRPAERARVVLIRVDLPAGERRVALDVEGPADTVIKAVQEALDAPPDRE